jgi:hypothetical protein
MRVRQTLILLLFSLFTFSQSWKDISQGIHFTDYVFYNNIHFGINISNSGSSIYKLNNGKWTRVFFGTITDYKIWNNKFVVAGDFVDSFNLRFFEDDTFKPMLKTNEYISTISVYGDSLLIVEGQHNSTSISDNIYWFHNNKKITINFSFANTMHIPVYLTSPVVNRNFIYSGGYFKTYYYEPGYDTMNFVNTDNLYQINLITNEAKLIEYNGSSWGGSLYKCFPFLDTLNYIRNYSILNSGGRPGFTEFCSSTEKNLPFKLCVINCFATEKDSLFFIESGILKKSFNGNLTNVVTADLLPIISLNKNMEGFFAVDIAGKILYLGKTEFLKTTLKTYKFDVSPNPAIDKIYINSITIIKDVKIYNSVGKLVIQTYQNEIELNSLSPGIYFIVADNNPALKFIKAQ